MATSPQTTPATYPSPRALQFSQVQGLLRLQKSAQRITSILDLDQLIEQIVTEVANSFDCVEANVYLCDHERQEMVLSGVHGCSVHGKGHRLKIGKQGMVGYVAATRQMRYAPDVEKDAYYLACELRTRSEVAIPLEAAGQLVGVFTASHHELDAFPPEQLRLLQGLADHMGVAVQNARLFQQERRDNQRMSNEAQEARVIQEALFPKSSPYVPGFAISGLSIPAGAVGGDWYDFLALDKNHWGLVLADVSGKGMAAALLMSATRGMLRSLAEACTCPGDVLTRLNRLLVEDFPRGRFVTLVYGVLDAASRTLTFANAGHLRPLLVNNSGAHFLDSDTGLPLGLTHSTFSAHLVELPPGSRLIFYSDGITEAVNQHDEEYGSERLAEHALGPEASAASLLASVRSFAGSMPQRDDATVIFVQA
jgi:sigma-B regulation protein RsbU (phosphoserine phosphatase)